MKLRRASAVLAAAALATVLPAATAVAAGTGQVTSPGANAVVAEPVPLVADVAGRGGTLLDPQPHRVRARLTDAAGAEPWTGTTVVDLACEQECEGNSTWTGPAFTPRTLAPFADAPACNGTYGVQVQVDGGAWTGHTIRLAAPPSPPAEVTVTPAVRAARVDWAAAPEPDVVAYHVQRRTGGDWQTLATVGADTRSLADEVAAGPVEYRVVSLRGDGLVDDAPAGPCADTQPDLATASPVVATTIPATRAEAQATPPASTGANAEGGADQDPGTTRDGAPADDGQPTDGSAAASDGEGASAPPASGDDSVAVQSRRRVAPPSSMQSGSRPPSVTVPDSGADRPAVASPQATRHYGDGEGYSEELDFGDVDAVEAMPEPGPTAQRVVSVPGALQGVLGEQLDLQRIVAPIAGGLVLLAAALHLRRWTRDGLTR